MIESLTPAQIEDMKAHRAKYLQIGWSTEPSDRPRAEKGMLALYRRIGRLKADAKTWSYAATGDDKVDEAEVARLSENGKLFGFIWFPSPAAAVDTIVDSTGSYQGFSGVDGQIDAYWLSFYTFGIKLGCEVTEEDKAHLAEWQDVIESTGPCWPNENVCLMTERPIKASYDDRERLHNDTGPALEYKDGFALYAVHGVRVTKQIVMEPETMKPEEISKETNPEIRRIMIEKYGPQKYLEGTGAELIDEDVAAGHPRGLFKDQGGLFWLMCTDGGTGRVYTLPVPEVETCQDAHEAISGISEKTIKAEG